MTAISRRAEKALVIFAGLVFIVAFLRFFSTGETGGKAKEWAYGKVSSITGGNGDGNRPSLRSAITSAEASWAKTVKQRKEMIAADYGDVSKMPLFPCKDFPSYVSHPYSIWDFIPAAFGCPYEMERVGRMGDGGKWVCGMSRYENFPKGRECVIYSFGVRDESSFENEMLSRTNCRIWAYDFTVVDFGSQVEQKNRDRATFVQAGISGKTDKTKNPPFYSISDLMKMNGHTYIDILKMDIEFAEFEAMDGLADDFPVISDELPIGQLMVEIHLFNDITSARFLEWWQRLESRGLRPTWTEPNLLAVTLNLAGNHDPTLAEYTLVNVHDSRNVLFNGRQL